MDLKKYCQESGLINATEIEKVRLLVYYYYLTEGKVEFKREDIIAWFEKMHLSRPNMSRLMERIRRSKAFIKGKNSNFLKLHAMELEQLRLQYGSLDIESDEIISEDAVLPRSLFEGTRGFIESIAKQINASYENNICDGCAVLMRRLIEIILILAYEHLNIQAMIKDSQQNYYPLEKITNDAIKNKTLNLSRDSKNVLDEFRTIGNFSAHKIYYNCRKSELKKVCLSYRATIEELLYKSGIKK